MIIEHNHAFYTVSLIALLIMISFFVVIVVVVIRCTICLLCCCCRYGSTATLAAVLVAKLLLSKHNSLRVWYQPIESFSSLHKNLAVGIWPKCLGQILPIIWRRVSGQIQILENVGSWLIHKGGRGAVFSQNFENFGRWLTHKVEPHGIILFGRSVGGRITKRGDGMTCEEAESML